MSRDRRFAADQLLRKHGWRIYSRKKNREPVWEKAGRLLPQEEALAEITTDSPR